MNGDNHYATGACLASEEMMELKEKRLKRLCYRSRHRGCKETDAVLGHFADRYLSTLDAAALDLYEWFLDEADNDIWDWVTGKTAPTHPEYAAIIIQLKTYAETHAAAVL